MYVSPKNFDSSLSVCLYREMTSLVMSWVKERRKSKGEKAAACSESVESVEKVNAFTFNSSVERARDKYDFFILLPDSTYEVYRKLLKLSVARMVNSMGEA